jgi:hypothetical protein
MHSNSDALISRRSFSLALCAPSNLRWARRNPVVLNGTCGQWLNVATPMMGGLTAGAASWGLAARPRLVLLRPSRAGWRTPHNSYLGIAPVLSGASTPWPSPQITGHMTQLQIEWIVRGCSTSCFWTAPRRLIEALESLRGSVIRAVTPQRSSESQIGV